MKERFSYPQMHRNTSRFKKKGIGLSMLFLATSLFGASYTEQCSIGQYLDQYTNQCQACSTSCKSCSLDSDRCLACRDDKMAYDEISGGCSCPQGSYFDPQQGLCETIRSSFGNRTDRGGQKLKFSSMKGSQLKRRNLQTLTPSTDKIIIDQGSQTTFSNIHFSRTDGTFDNDYMISVASFQPGITVTFTNSTIDVRGNFFKSVYPVNLVFDGCTFLLANTLNLLTLDYSAGSIYGCTSGDLTTQGDVLIKNSVFKDQASGIALSVSSTAKYLFNVKSLYDFKFNGVTFSGLGQRHAALFYDHPCISDPLKVQQISLDHLTVANSNARFVFQFDSFASSAVNAQLNFALSNSQFSQITLSQSSWLNFLLKRQTQLIQAFDLSSLTLSSLNIDQVPFVQLLLHSQTGPQVTSSSVNVTASIMTDFLKVDTAQSFVSSTLKFDTVDGSQAPISYDSSKSGLLSILSVPSVQISYLQALSSTLTIAPALYIESSSAIKIQHCIFQSVKVAGSDMIAVKKPQSVTLKNTTMVNILNNLLSTTRYALSVSSITLVNPEKSFLTIDTPTFKNSSVSLINVNSYTFASATDMNKYLITIQYCTFSNNLFNGYQMLTFTDLPTATFDLVNSFCILDNLKPTCPNGQYYDTILQACTVCPTGCATCNSDTQCTTCTISSMVVNPMSGLCECPAKQYYYAVDGLPRCRQCLDKCQTCNNEYKCLTYSKCTNSLQSLNANGQCDFSCKTGLVQSSCASCTLPNCQLCDTSPLGSQSCALCSNGYYLDLKTYTCVQQCPSNSKAISSNNVQSVGKTVSVKYCRPFSNATAFTYEYWINPNSTSHIELGTIEYPFKNMDSPAKEIFNFMYEKDTIFTVYHMRGTSMKHYYGIMPIIIVNVKNYLLTTYGNSSLPKPYVYITGHDYLWPDSTLFSLAETYYDFSTRVSRGDMDVSESTKFFLKFNVFRSSMHIQSLDFQSIMFGDAWSNPLIFSFDAPNQTVIVEDCYLDLDGAFYEAYFPISVRVTNCHFNLTNYQYGVWNDFRWDCYANNQTDLGGYLIIENSLFTDKHQQALYNFFFFSSFDDFIIRNNTFDGCTYLDMETRPFVDSHPQTMCDPEYRTQNVLIDSNHFLNLDGSSLMFAINYMSDFNGTKVFSMQNNVYENSSINTQLISMQIQNYAQVTVGNNYYKNVTVLKDKKVFYFFSEPTTLYIQNETLINNVLDDLYTIGAARNVIIQDFMVTGNQNTGAITETSAILRISTASTNCQITNFSVTNSSFKYGKAIEIEQARQLLFSNAKYSQNSLQNQDFFVFNQITRTNISNLIFDQFSKISDKSRYAISIPTLSLIRSQSYYNIKNISFTNSHASFLSVSQVQTAIGTFSAAPFFFTISNCIVQNNSLSSKDSLIEFGEINFMSFSVQLSNVNIINNILELGTIYQLKLNCKEFTIASSNILGNQGQFALLEPASSDETNPLMFNIYKTNFTQNYARADALVQLTTNSKLKVTDSTFVENFSVGRGSIVFADYQAVYAYFNNCTFERNYAYQGGVFYVQYSSQVEVSNSTITQNFGVTGGVAYVNNDGQIKITNGTRVFKNSALNTCFLFLINTQFESQLDSITITKNDQNNSLIPKELFLSINSSYQHMSSEYFAKMALIADKIQRTINEKADSAVYAIKAKVNISNSDIYQNDIFLSASTESTIGMSNTTVRDLVATGKVFQSVSSVIEMNGVRMSHINYTTAISQVSGINVTNPDGSTSTISISEPTDVQTTVSNFYKLTVVNKSILRALNCTFDFINGLFLYVSGSTLEIQSSSSIRDLTNDDESQPLIAIDTSSVSFGDTNFTRLSSQRVSPLFNLQETDLHSVNVTFGDFDKTLFSLESGNYVFDTLHISKGRMTWMSEQDSFMVNSIVFDVAAADLTLENADIRGIFTNYSSPVIYIENDPTASQQHELVLNRSLFINNVANESAGVILSVNTNVTVDGCLFENNTAILSDAGAIYLDCQDTSLLPCKYTIKNSIFKNNTAHIDGGAIKYTFYSPDISQNNTFNLNNASYGQDIASYPVQMKILDSLSQQSTQSNRRVLSMLNSSEVQRLNLPANSIVFQMDNPLVSGSLLTQNISLELLDDKNRSMITDNSSIAIMSTTSSTVTVMKSKSVKADQGRFKFDDVIVVGPPGTDILLKITTDSINKDKIAYAYPNLNGQLPDIYIKGYLRLCQRGEYQTTDYKCILCSDGFFTLIENQQQCSECPENAVCQDGFNIILDPGFWRTNVTSIQIFECYNKYACLGGYNSTCALGYGGNLCHTCVKHNDIQYSREQNNECIECLNYTTNSWRLAGVTVLVIAYFIALIYVNISESRNNSDQQNLSTVYMRILTNYFQILTLASSYDLSWSDNMKQFLQYISIIAQSSQILFSVDCFIKDNNITIEPIYFKMILACLFPLLCIAIVAVFWFIYERFRKNNKNLTKFITSVIILIFMTLPQVTTITFAIYNCIDVFADGRSFLAIDMSLQCWAGDHQFYSNRFGVPIIIIWILGLPVSALIILYRKRKALSEDQNMARYGFLYTGLNHTCFYWEILLHFRKVLMICINVFLTTFKPLYRALIGFMLMIIYIEGLQKFQPYASPEINNLEFKANMAAFATFYGGLFFISNDLPFSVTVILFLLILFINLYFWFCWVKLMFNRKYEIVHNFFAKLFCNKRNAHIEHADFNDQQLVDDINHGGRTKLAEENIGDMSRLPLGEGDESFMDESHIGGQTAGGYGTYKKGGKAKSSGKAKDGRSVDATMFINEDEGMGPEHDRSQYHNEEEFEEDEDFNQKQVQQKNNINGGKNQNASQKKKQANAGDDLQEYTFDQRQKAAKAGGKDGPFKQNANKVKNVKNMESSDQDEQERSNNSGNPVVDSSPSGEQQVKKKRVKDSYQSAPGGNRKQQSPSREQKKGQREADLNPQSNAIQLSVESIGKYSDDLEDVPDHYRTKQEKPQQKAQKKKRQTTDSEKRLDKKSTGKAGRSTGGNAAPSTSDVNSSSASNGAINTNQEAATSLLNHNNGNDSSMQNNRGTRDAKENKKMNAGEIIDKDTSTNKDSGGGAYNHHQDGYSSEMKISHESAPRIPINDSNVLDAVPQRNVSTAAVEDQGKRKRSEKREASQQRQVAASEVAPTRTEQIVKESKSKRRKRSGSSIESSQERRVHPEKEGARKPQPTTAKHQPQSQIQDSDLSGQSSKIEEKQQINQQELKAQLAKAAAKQQSKQRQPSSEGSNEDYEEDEDDNSGMKVQSMKHKYQKQMEKKGRNAPDKPKPQGPQIDLSQQQQTVAGGGAPMMNQTMKEKEKLFKKGAVNPMDRTVQNFARKKEPRMIDNKRGGGQEIDEERSDDESERSRSPEGGQQRRGASQMQQKQERSKSNKRSPPQREYPEEDDDSYQEEQRRKASKNRQAAEMQKPRDGASRQRVKNQRQEEEEDDESEPYYQQQPAKKQERNPPQKDPARAAQNQKAKADAARIKDNLYISDEDELSPSQDAAEYESSEFDKGRRKGHRQQPQKKGGAGAGPQPRRRDDSSSEDQRIQQKQQKGGRGQSKGPTNPRERDQSDNRQQQRKGGQQMRGKRSPSDGSSSV